MAIGYLARYTLRMLTGITEDECVMDTSWIWDGAGAPAGTNFTELTQAWAQFLTQDSGGSQTNKVDHYLGNQVDRTSTGGQMDIYAIPNTAGPLGSPIYSASVGPLQTLSGAGNLPAEVAFKLSMNADLTGVLEESGSTRPRARRRGGFFLGPLNLAAADDAPTFEARPLGVFRNDVREAAAAFLGTAAAADDWTLAIWSRADWVLRPAVAVSTDDAFDTIRGRGPDPTARVSTAL